MEKRFFFNTITLVLININIMIGSGVFINTTEVARRAGIWGCMSYALVGLLLLPLVLTISELLKMYPNQGFFGFAKSGINTFAGFMNTWSYFFAKLGSATLSLHIFVTTAQAVIPALALIHPFVCDILLLSAITFLNTRNVKMGTSLQKYLVVAKSIPLMMVIGLGFFYGTIQTGSIAAHISPDFLSSIPLVLFSLLGFEAICSLSSTMDNRNSYKAVLVSYGTVTLLYVLYQLLVFLALHDSIMGMTNFKQAFPALFGLMTSDPQTITILCNLVYILIGTSALSGSYGILFSNQWNLYTLAQNNTFRASRFFARVNQHNIPILCTITELCIVIAYLFITNGQQFILQQIAAFGTTLTYTISTIALYRSNPEKRLLSAFALASCSILLATCIRNFMQTGIIAFAFFCIIMICGGLLFKSTEKSSSH